MFLTLFALSLNIGSVKVLATSDETPASSTTSTGPVWERVWNDSYKDHPSTKATTESTNTTTESTVEPITEPTPEPTFEPTFEPTPEPVYEEPSYDEDFWKDEEETSSTYDDFWDDEMPDSNDNPNLPDNSYNENVIVDAPVPDYTPPSFDPENVLEIKMPDGRTFKLNKRGNGLYYVYDEDEYALGYIKSDTEPTVEDFLELDSILLPFGKKNPETSDFSGVLIPITIVLLGASFFIYGKYFKHLKED